MVLKLDVAREADRSDRMGIEPLPAMTSGHHSRDWTRYAAADRVDDVYQAQDVEGWGVQMRENRNCRLVCHSLVLFSFLLDYSPSGPFGLFCRTMGCRIRGRGGGGGSSPGRNAGIPGEAVLAATVPCQGTKWQGRPHQSAMVTVRGGGG